VSRQLAKDPPDLSIADYVPGTVIKVNKWFEFIDVEDDPDFPDKPIPFGAAIEKTSKR
jgi:hypothetical protein